MYRKVISCIGDGASPPAGPTAYPLNAAVIDLELGVRQLEGNDGLYRELLRRFLREYGSAGERMRHLLDKGERKEALILAHAVKGVAGVLAAERLRVAAQALEGALKGGEGDLDALMGCFARDLERVLFFLESEVGDAEEALTLVEGLPRE